jgi:hypothetical protein
MSLFDPDKAEWPFEAQIDAPDGAREYSQFAKDNGDGTVSIISWGENGPMVKTFPIEQATLKERPWELAEKWYALFRKIFGSHLKI